MSIIEKELSYKIRGILIDISKKYGYLYKEEFYHNALKEELNDSGMDFVSQPKINICSIKSGKVLSKYVPDFLIENRIIVELKAQPYLIAETVKQLDQYLKASKYEVGLLVNFGEPTANIVRRIYTNDRKYFIK